MKKFIIITLFLFSVTTMLSQNLYDYSLKISKAINIKNDTIFNQKDLIPVGIDKRYLNDLKFIRVEKDILLEKEKLIFQKLIVAKNNISIDSTSNIHLAFYDKSKDYLLYMAKMKTFESFNNRDSTFIYVAQAPDTEIVNLFQEYENLKRTEISEISDEEKLENENIIPLSNILGSSPIISSPSLIIDGTSKFLVEKTKQELNIAFIDKFRNVFKKFEDFHILFPSSSNVILNNDPLNFSNWGMQLKPAAISDINALPVNFSIFIKTSELYNRLNDKEKELLDAFFIIMHTLQMEYNGIEPFVMFNYINQEFGYNSGGSMVINKSISFLHAISESFYRNETNVYVPVDSIINMNTHAKIVFLDIFAAKNRNLLESININDKSVYLHITTQIKYYQSKQYKTWDNFIFMAAAKLIPTIRILNKSIKELKKNIDKSAKREEYKKINNEILTLYDIAFNLYYMNNLTALYENDAYYVKYKPIVQNTIDLNNYLLDENYPAALIAFNNIVNNGIKFIINETPALSNVENVNKIVEMINGIVYWGGFVTEIASMDSSYQVKNMLKKYAEPVGSYRIKRKFMSSISLNSFPGLYIGGETYKNGNSEWSNGITAPIGFSFNFAGRKEVKNFKDYDFINKKNKIKQYKGNVWGLYISVIDIAAPFVYRWSNDETEGFPEDIKWEQVFSPGGHITYGCKNSGLTFMFGAQMTPSLRKITENEIELYERSLRYGISLTYDIPVFTMYKKRYKKTKII